MVAIQEEIVSAVKPITMQINKPGMSSPILTGPDVIRRPAEQTTRAIVVPLMETVDMAKTLSQQSPFSTVGRVT